MKKLAFIILSFFLLFTFMNISAQQFEGQWKIVNSQNANGTDYSGTIWISKLNDQIYELSFILKYENSNFEMLGRGIGIAEGNKLYVAREIVECDECSGDLYGVAVYNIKDDKLEGKWLRYLEETKGKLCEETITIKKEELDGEYYWNGPYTCKRKLPDNKIENDSVATTRYGNAFYLHYQVLNFNEASEFLDSYPVIGTGIINSDNNTLGVALYGGGLFGNPIQYVEYEFTDNEAKGELLEIADESLSFENLKKE